MKEAASSARRPTSSCNCCISEGPVSETALIDGIAASMTLLAMSARRLRSIVGLAEARTIRTLDRRRWRNSSRRKAAESADVLSLSPNSCCMRCSSCVGLRSPSSSLLMSCWSLRCSEVAVRLTSSVFRMSYGRSAGGLRRRSHTSVSQGADHLV